MTARLPATLRLGIGAFAVAMAAAWGIYAQLLRVPCSNEGSASPEFICAALQEKAPASKSSAPGLRPAVSAEGETPAAPPTFKPALDDAKPTAPQAYVVAPPSALRPPCASGLAPPPPDTACSFIPARQAPNRAPRGPPAA